MSMIVDEVTVLGLGTMGHGIAQRFALAGCRVHCYDEQATVRDSLVDRCAANLYAMAEADVIDASQIEETIARLDVCFDEVDAVGPAQFVTEAVREDLGVKRELFLRLESLVGPETILASNTSTFPMTQIAESMNMPERAIDTHWFNPPHLVPLVEVIPGARTSEETIAVTMKLLERIGKMPIRLNKEVPGFVVNRIQVAMMREVWDLCERGVASEEDIDRAVRGSVGLRLAVTGPITVWDFAGVDVCSAVYQNLASDLRADGKLPEVPRKLVEAGRFGVKSGRGAFDYPPQEREAKRSDRDRNYLALLKQLHSGVAPGARSG